MLSLLRTLDAEPQRVHRFLAGTEAPAVGDLAKRVTALVRRKPNSPEAAEPVAERRE